MRLFCSLKTCNTPKEENKFIQLTCLTSCCCCSFLTNNYKTKRTHVSSYALIHTYIYRKIFTTLYEITYSRTAWRIRKPQQNIIKLLASLLRGRIYLNFQFIFSVATKSAKSVISYTLASMQTSYKVWVLSEINFYSSSEQRLVVVELPWIMYVCLTS